METISIWFILIYALLVFAGGIFGYMRAKSLPSLIAGSVSGILLLVSFGYSLSNQAMGLLIAAVLAVLLFVVFLLRYRRTGKFFPSGLMLGISVVAAILFLVGMISAMAA